MMFSRMEGSVHFSERVTPKNPMAILGLREESAMVTARPAVHIFQADDVIFTEVAA